MKTFFLLAFSLICFNSFSQDRPIDPNDPSSDHTYWETTIVYGCDANGNKNTNPNSEDYVEYGIKYLVYVGSGDSRPYTTSLSDIETILCRNGNFMLLPIGVEILWKVQNGIRTDYKPTFPPLKTKN